MAFSTSNESSTKDMSAAETPASHMHRMTGFDRGVESFYQRQTGKDLSLASLTSFMDDSLLRSGPMSYQQHQDYHPIIDELVFYVT